MLKIAVFALGLVMTGIIGNSFVLPLWRQGLKAMAVISFALLLAAVGGLGWLLWTLAA
jgi:hypothetical protein